MNIIREQNEKEIKAHEEAYKEYANFLLNEWTPKLKMFGIIPPDDIINICNSNADRNEKLLNKLRNINYSAYDEMASKFIMVKSAIVNNGGSLGRS